MILKHTNAKAGLVLVAFLVLAVILAFGRTTDAQQGLLKGADRSVSQNRGAFDSILSKHGARDMLLTVEILVAGPKIDKDEVIGKLAESTDSFLVVKLQNQRDLVFIPWERVLTVTARPSS